MANSIYRGAGVTIPVNPLLQTNRFTLAAGEVMIIPAGTWWLSGTTYCVVQQFDPVTLTWVNVGAETGPQQVMSDGVNYRILNGTATVVSTTITSAGTGYTAAPTITPSAGGSTYTAIIGGSVSSVTVNSGGVYGLAPQVIFSAPGNQGIAATGYATLTNGAVSAVTVSTAGAGYVNPPSITFVTDPRDTVAITAPNVTVNMGGSGTITGLLVTYPGTPLGSAPTLTVGGNGTATATLNAQAATVETFYLNQL